MDKTEYRMKLDEINSLVEAQDYEGALQVADSIEWRRVKSIRTLCMVADIYEVNGRLEDSMKMLQLAYKRSSVGKMILYRLVELCLKMGRYDDAVSYYNEYLETASNDTSKYILKYKILKAQKAPLDDQIEVLEEYKDREYTERWVYELAKLYKKAGKERKCVETCDDLILWFGEGKYVTKAMELKMTYTPLSASQREKYRIAAGASGQTVLPDTGKRKDTGERIGEGSQAGAAADGIKPAMVMETAAAASESGIPEADASPSQEKAPAPETAYTGEDDRERRYSRPGEAGSPQPAVDAGKIRENSVQLQERLAKSFQEVLAGINRTKTVNAFEALGKAAGTEPLKIPQEEENISDYQVKDLEPENTEEEVISAQKGDAIAHRTEKPSQPPREEKPRPEDREITSVNDVDLDALFAETSSMIAEAIGKDAQTDAQMEDVSESSEEKEADAAIQGEDPESRMEAERTSGTGSEKASREAEETEEPEAGEENTGSAREEESADEPGEELKAEAPGETLTEEKEESREADFSDIEEALAQAARSYVEEFSGEHTDTEDIRTEESAQAEEAGEEQPETAVAQEAEEPDPDETADTRETDEQERAMAAFAASLEELDISGEPAEDEEQEPEAEKETSQEQDAAVEAFEASLELDGMEVPAEDAREDSWEQESNAYPEEEFSEDNTAAFEDRDEPEMDDGTDEQQDPDALFTGALQGDTVDIEAELRAVLGEETVREDGKPGGEELVRQLFGETEGEAEEPLVEMRDPLDIAAELELDISSEDDGDRVVFEEDAGEIAEEEPDTEEPYADGSDMEAEGSEEAPESDGEDDGESTAEKELRDLLEDGADEAAGPGQDMETELEMALEETPEVQEETADAEEVSGEEEPEAGLEEAEEELPSEGQESEDRNEEMDFTPDLDMDIVLEAQKEKEEAELNIDQMLEEAEAEPDIPQTIPENETPEEKRIRIMNATRPDRLTDQQKKLFSYFAKVPGMDQQILDAINGAHSHAGEKTSHRGNIAIMGSHGTGKTRLSDGLVKALCKDLGLPAAKYARLDASDMNSKDPVRVIGKMAGGFLLIERAGHMSPETIAKLSKAMDFRTDSLILIIEDDKISMRKLLADYPEFAEKFTTVISIPVFTNDELVTFARTYARENGYRMDEMGVLALYTLIGDNQREDEPITIGKVKEMVDGAIRKAGGGLKLGRKISKRHTDAEGRIYLYEKDFDL